MTKYRVDGPERWKKGSPAHTSKATIACKVCKKKMDLTTSYRLWPDTPKSTYTWVCSDKCANFHILRGEDDEK